MTITELQSAGYNAAKGLAGEQPDDTETFHRCRSTGSVIGTRCNQCGELLDDPGCPLCLSCCDAELIDCACVEQHLFGADPHCPACDGLGVVTEANTWCDSCGLLGNCPDCDPDRDRDARGDR